MVSVNPVFLGSWLDALRPVHSKMTPALAATFLDQSRHETEHALATNILADYAKDDPTLIANLLMAADPKAYATFFPIARGQKAQTLPVLQAALEKKTNPAESDSDDEGIKDRSAKRQARAAVALVRLGYPNAVWAYLKHSADPRLRSFIVNWLNPLEADPHLLVAELDRLDAPVAQHAPPATQTMDAILFDPATSMRRALILALGTYETEGLPAGDREPLIRKLLRLYRNDPDSGIHGAAEWTLRRWKQDDKLDELDAHLVTIRDWGDRRWFLNGQGQTFAVIAGPVEFRTAAPKTDTESAPGNEPSRHIRIPRRFAIGAKEVTVEQFQRFLQVAKITSGRYHLSASSLAQHSPDPKGPWIAPEWYAAAHYCNWLSEQKGLPKDQWCYLPNQDGAYAEGMSIPAGFLERTGYRLPTEAEWEYTCRAGAVTSRFYGHSIDLLESYAWYQPNCKEHARVCGSLFSNDLGLFDTLGNASEWCQDSWDAPRPKTKELYNDAIDAASFVRETNLRATRGGGFDSPQGNVWSASRNWNPPSHRSPFTGFRVARTYH
jgi:hypothetical protein